MKNETNQSKKRGCLHTCLITIVVFLLICGVIGIIMSLTMDEITTKKSMIGKYVELTDIQAQRIDEILLDCGINKIDNLEHDSLLDDVHSNGETGYRLTSGNIDNIILYLTADFNVHLIKYIDYDLYSNGAKIATIGDYTVSLDEVNKYQNLCEEKVKEVLKSPNTAKFPNYTEWGWKQEMDLFTVQGYVDAQNGFGAEIRSTFQFVININTDTIQSFIFDGNELIM